MTSVQDLVQELLNKCYRESVRVADLLELAKAVAAKYKLQDFEKWVDRERKGYGKNDLDALPEYRWVESTTKILSPGSVPAQIDLEEPQKVPVFKPMMEIEYIKRWPEKSGSERWGQETYKVSEAQYEPLFRAVIDKIFNTVKRLHDQNTNAGTGSVNVVRSKGVVVNTGQQTGNQIDVSIASLRETDNEKVAEAFEAIKNEIATGREFTQENQTEILQMLNLLASQAALPQQQRQRGIIKPMLTDLATALSAGGGAAEIWNTAGPIIKGFLGM